MVISSPLSILKAQKGFYHCYTEHQELIDSWSLQLLEDFFYSILLRGVVRNGAMISIQRSFCEEKI